MFIKIAAFSMLLAFASAVDDAVDKEIVYAYDGFLSVGTNQPADFHSYSWIAADLIVFKQKNNDYWMQLENVNYRAFSGSKAYETGDNETDWHLVPKESGAVDLPFIYHKYSDKSKNGITTMKEDLPWSRNFKKAIADLFLNDQRVFEGETQSFKSEDGFDYYVMGTEKLIRVTKTMSGDMFQNYAKETNDDIKVDEHFPLPIFRKYNYEIYPKTQNVKKVIAISQVEYNPLNGMSEKFFMFVNQTLTYKKKRDSELKMDVDSMKYSDVDFTMNAYFTEAGGLDLSKGRVEIDLDETVKDLKRDLKKFFDYLSQSHITLTKTFINEDDHIDSVIRRLKYLDEKHLIKLYSSVVDNDDLSKLLVEIISLLGTPASCHFIVNMIEEKKLTGVEALDALSDIPMHAIILPVELKTNLMKLVANKDEDISRQAVLTLSNMVSKSVNKPGYEYSDVVDSFIAKLQGSTVPKEQLLYIYALRNIRSARTNQEMFKIAKGSKGYSHLTTHARAESFYGLERSQEAEDFMWLMFLNKQEKFEIRVAIMNILVTFDRPLNVEKMFYVLNEENDDDELNHLFYKKLVMLSETDQDQYDKGSTRAAELLPYFDKPVESHSKSSAELLELLDDATGVGSVFELTYYGDISEHNFTMIRLKSTTKLSGPTSDVNEYYAYTEFDYSDIGMENALEKIMNMGLDFVEVANGRVLSARSHGWVDLMALVLSAEETNSKKKMYMMDQQHRDEILVPSDMGIPVVFRNNAGYLFKLESRFEKELQGKAVFDMVYRSSEIYGFTSYNPISNTWAGIRRVKTIDLNLGFDIDYKMDMENKLLKATLNKSKNPSGIQSFVYSHVFARDPLDGQLVKKSCPKCELDNLITGGEGQLEGHVYLDYDNEDTGSYYKMSVYDCEQRVTASYLSMTDIDQLWNVFMASPTPGMCGVGFMLKNSEKYPATHLTLQLSADDYEYDDALYDDHDAFKLVYNIKNGDKLVKSWDFRFVNGRFNQTWYNGKISATEIKAGVPVYRFCYDVVENWYRDYMTSTSIISAGKDIEDIKCPKTGSIIKIKGTGEQSEEMKKLADPEKVFSNCIDDHSNSFADCLREVSSYRKYTYDVTFNNLNDNEVDFWKKITDYLRLSYSDEFIRMKRHPDIAENQLKITANYPLYYDSVNVTIMDHHEAYRYDDVEISEYYDLMYPAPYSVFTKSNDKFNDYCEVGAEYVTNEPGEDHRTLNYTDNWALLSKLHREAFGMKGLVIYEIKTKRVSEESDDIILRIEYYEDNILELSFVDGKFHLVINKEVKEMKPNVLMPIHDYFDILMTNNDGENHRVFVNMPESSSAVEYTRNKIRMSLNSRGNGLCDEEEEE